VKDFLRSVTRKGKSRQVPKEGEIGQVRTFIWDRKMGSSMKQSSAVRKREFYNRAETLCSQSQGKTIEKRITTPEGKEKELDWCGKKGKGFPKAYENAV